MAGFIRTSSIKAYMSKRSIITPILFYYGAQRWVHFMSTIKKKSDEDDDDGDEDSEWKK